MPTHVAVTLIRCGEKLLLVYNEKWRAFTFPMSKLPHWEVLEESVAGADAEQQALLEEAQEAYWRDAAADAAVECLGHPVSPSPLGGGFEVEYPVVETSRRDGASRAYRHRVFEVTIDGAPPVLSVPHVWLTPAETRDPDLRPISPTVREILGRAEISEIVEGWT